MIFLHYFWFEHIPLNICIVCRPSYIVHMLYWPILTCGHALCNNACTCINIKLIGMSHAQLACSGHICMPE